MAEPKKISQEEYDKFRANMEEKYGYDDMSDDEKADFDNKIDQVAVVGDNADQTDATDDEEIEKGEFEDGYPHEHDREDGDEGIR